MPPPRCEWWLGLEDDDFISRDSRFATNLVGSRVYLFDFGLILDNLDLAVIDGYDVHQEMFSTSNRVYLDSGIM